MTLLDLPTSLRARYHKAGPDQQTKIRLRMDAMAVLASKPRSAWESTATVLAAQLTREHGRGFSATRLLNLFRAYRQDGAEALLFAYGQADKKPDAFLQHLAARVENNKRVASVALEELHADWFAGKDIPGYGTWQNLWVSQHGEGEPIPDHCPDWFLPKGWDLRNLRRHLPGEAELEFARRGVFAAHGLLPQKRNDYSQLMPLQIVVFDDVRCDFLVKHPDADKACEMWMLVAMDAASRVILDWISLVRVPDDAGKRAEFLGEHMLILAGNILRRYGVPTGYEMTLKVENAKATINRDRAAYLSHMSGKRVTVEYTEMKNRALPNGHKERHGTPWDIKGILESFFKNFHNHTAALPGHTGATYDQAPAELKSRQDELIALMKECDDLPASIKDQLQLPFLRSSEAVETIQAVFDHIANSARHNLQGFDKIELFRFPEDHHWRPLEDLRRYSKADVARAIFETRMETRRQRFEKLMRRAPGFSEVPGEALIPFLARTVKRVRHPAPYTIAWTEGGNILWTFRADDIPELKGQRSGKDFFVRYLPDSVNAAWLYDAESGRQLGVMQRVGVPVIGDEAAQSKALGELAHARALVTGPVMARHAGERETKAAAAATNQAIINAARAGTEMQTQAAQGAATVRKETAAQAARNTRRAKQLAARHVAEAAND